LVNLHVGLVERRRLLVKTLAIAIVVSGSLAVAQIAASVLTSSVGIRAATVDRFIDLLVHCGALLGVWTATRPPDSKHPYGYERYETLTSMAIGVILLITVAVVVRGSIERLFEPASVDLPLLGIAVMTVASVASFALTWFLNLMARASGSEVIRAESSHAWADGMTSAAIVGGIFCSELGLDRVDPAIALAVSGLIGVRAIRLVLGAANLLTDASLVGIDEIVGVCSRVEGVIDCHAVRSRGGAGRIRVDLHIHVDPDLPVRQAHEIGVRVEAAVKQHIPGVAEVLVHIGAAGGPV
jgi:cation diffusion facilitator family transporter